MTKMVVQKIYIDEDPNLSLEHEQCPDCAKLGKIFNLRYMYLNLQEAVYKCSSPDCMFPYRNFKFKNYKDKTVYRYDILSSVIEENGTEGSWIDSLPISPLKQPPMKNEPTQTQGLDFLDVASLDTIDRIKNSNAMDQLQSELNDILSSHCDELGSLASDKNQEKSVKVERDPPKSIETLVVTNKPRKLSKCYDFIKQKSQLSNTQQPSSSFKIPSQPVKETLSRKMIPHHDKSPNKHRSPRSKRHSYHVTTRNNMSEVKALKIENRRNEDRLEALSFLNHLQNLNKTHVDPVTNEVPITIEVLPESDMEINENVVIKVENTNFNYYGDS